MAEFSNSEFSFSRHPKPRANSGSPPEGPKSVLVMGNFSGSAAEPGVEKGDGVGRRRRIDFDSFEQVLADMAPVVRWSQAGQGEAPAVKIRSLDDFHPDQLYQRVSILEPLRTARQLVKHDPGSVEAVAAVLGDAGLLIAAAGNGTADCKGPRDDAATGPENATNDEAPAAMFDRLLGERTVQENRESAQVDISSLLKRAVEGRIVPSAPTRQAQVLASIEMAIHQTMRFLLHDPAFQSLESAWRSLRQLVTLPDASDLVRIYVLDLSKARLVADLAAGSDWRGTGVYRTVVEMASDRWAMLVGDYRFGSQPEDIASLAMLGGIAAEAGCPFVAQADASLLGCRSIVETPAPSEWDAPGADALQAWRQLRSSDLAPWIGLALPRVLLRLPYGQRTDPVEMLAMEEFGEPDEHDHYVWGNPAYVCAQLAMQAWGQGAACGTLLDIEDLPAYTYVAPDGESLLKACAEVFLSDHSAEAILQRGIMPLISSQNRNVARLLRFQSIAEPLAPLAGI